jgi:DNA repair exonuclease SbcCD ATPase subunit
MLKIKSLKLKNFRRFVSEQIITFENRDFLIQVDGQNLNTGGSSGSGKSSIFMALDYLFGVNELPASSLQSMLTKDGIEVEGVFDRDGEEVLISRGKKNGLVITTSTETFSGNSKLSEEKLDEVIGIDRAIFRKMYHKRQKEGGFFLEMTPKQIYEFLSDVLNLRSWTDKTPVIDQSIKDLNSKLIGINSKISSLSSQISNYENIKLSITKPTKPEESYAMCDQLIEIINKDTQNLEATRAKWKEKLTNLKPPEPKKYVRDNSKLLEIDSKIGLKSESLKKEKREFDDKMNQMRKVYQGFQNDLSTIDRNSKKIPDIKAQIASYDNDLKHLQEMKCHTCMQIWIGDKSKEKIEELKSKKQSLELELDSILKESLTKDPLISKMEKLENIIKSKQNEDPTIPISNEIAILNREKGDILMQFSVEESEVNSINQAAQLAYNSEYRELISQESSEIQSISSKIDQSRSTLSNHKNAILFYEKSLVDYDNNIQNVDKHLSTGNADIESLNKELSDTQILITVMEESKRFIKSYVTKIFQDSLDQIGDRATMILSNIPNMANSSIYFETAKETKDGKVKEEVTGIINMDGENEFPIKSLSGGERTSIDLAVDLAVIDLIESKAGKGLDLFVLDEPFVGLDSTASLAAIDLLKNIDSNKRIVIIEHNPEIKESIVDKITAVRNGTESVIN